MICHKKIYLSFFITFFVFLFFSFSVKASNILQNGEFTSDLSGWSFYSDKGSNTSAFANGKAQVTIGDNTTTNTQLNQVGFSLKPSTQYTISYDISGSRVGIPLSVSVFKNQQPNTGYGYSKSLATQTSSTSYSETFTTSGFSSETTDTRLMFYFVGGLQNGDTITIDNVSIEEGDATGGGNTFSKYDFNEDGKEDILDLIDIVKHIFGG